VDRQYLSVEELESESEGSERDGGEEEGVDYVSGRKSQKKCLQQACVWAD